MLGKKCGYFGKKRFGNYWKCIYWRKTQIIWQQGYESALIVHLHAYTEISVWLKYYSSPFPHFPVLLMLLFHGTSKSYSHLTNFAHIDISRRSDKTVRRKCGMAAVARTDLPESFRTLQVAFSFHVHFAKLWKKYHYGSTHSCLDETNFFLKLCMTINYMFSCVFSRCLFFFLICLLDFWKAA